MELSTHLVFVVLIVSLFNIALNVVRSFLIFPFPFWLPSLATKLYSLHMALIEPTIFFKVIQGALVECVTGIILEGNESFDH